MYRILYKLKNNNIFRNNDYIKYKKKNSLYKQHIKENNNYLQKIVDDTDSINSNHNNLITNNIHNNDNIGNIDNNIILYNSKLDYIKKELSNFNEKEHFCSICIEKKKSCEFCILLCGHHFCKNCMKEYLNNKYDEFHECPVCRFKFKKNNIFYPIIENNNCDNSNLGTKINTLIDIIKKDYENKIVIVTQFKRTMENINKILANNNMKIYNINNFNNFSNEIDKSLLLISYNDILKINNLNITSIIFLDYLNDNNPFNNSNNPINILKNKLLCDNFVNFYFLYIKNTFEENIINNIKISIDDL